MGINLFCSGEKNCERLIVITKPVCNIAVCNFFIFPLTFTISHPIKKSLAHRFLYILGSLALTSCYSVLIYYNLQLYDFQYYAFILNTKSIYIPRNHIIPHFFRLYFNLIRLLLLFFCIIFLQDLLHLPIR